jgi:CheY-like chemotaxis protein
MSTRKPGCIMLIDNNPDDNFYHTRVIKKKDPSVEVLVMSSATDALAYLQAPDKNKRQPDLIFLDINMPGMNGWDFMERYQLQVPKSEGEALVIIMLTTSENPDDRRRALQSGAITAYMTKPLTLDMLASIDGNFF